MFSQELWFLEKYGRYVATHFEFDELLFFCVPAIILLVALMKFRIRPVTEALLIASVMYCFAFIEVDGSNVIETVFWSSFRVLPPLIPIILVFWSLRVVTRRYLVNKE